MDAKERSIARRKWLDRYDSRSELNHVARAVAYGLYLALVLRIIGLFLPVGTTSWPGLILTWAGMEYAYLKLKRFWYARSCGPSNRTLKQSG